MIEGSVVAFIENMFTTWRLYGWCDQVNEAIDELQAVDDPETGMIADRYLRNILSRSKTDKESALLSLVVLHRRNVPLSELFELAYRNLNGRLYVTDFPFLVANLFDGVIPLPQSLAYDITEKLFFSIERIFEQLVKDFQRVPFTNGEPILFYLMLENCRLDLTAQNKELVCIILTHIELRLPAPILDDIVAYLDANTSLGENWAEQRRIITFGRALEHEREAAPEGRGAIDNSSGESDATHPSPEPVPGHSIGAETRVPDLSAAPMQDRSDEVSTRQEFPDRPGVGRGEERKAVDAGSSSESAQPRPETQLLEPAARIDESSPPDTNEGGKAWQSDTTPGMRSGIPRNTPKSGGTQANAASNTVPEDNRVRHPRYGRFMESAKERGILLSRLDPRRWKRRLTDDASARDAKLSAVGVSRQSNTPSLSRRAKWLRALIVLLGLLILALLLLFTSGVRHRPSPAGGATGTMERTNARRAIARSMIDSAQVPTPALGDAASATDRFRFEVTRGRIIWQVKRGDTLYDLYLYLSNATHSATLDARLASASRLTWQEFRARIVALNPAPDGQPSDLDLIFPRDQYVISR